MVGTVGIIFLQVCISMNNLTVGGSQGTLSPRGGSENAKFYAVSSRNLWTLTQEWLWRSPIAQCQIKCCPGQSTRSPTWLVLKVFKIQDWPMIIQKPQGMWKAVPKPSDSNYSNDCTQVLSLQCCKPWSKWLYVVWLVPFFLSIGRACEKTYSSIQK